MFGEYLLSEYVYVCDSSRAGKQSYHIIIDRYYVRDHTTARKFAESVRDMLVSENYNDAAECIDMNIYKSVTGLRSAYNYKKDPNSVKKIPLGNYNYCS